MTMEYENIINDAFDAKDSAPHQIFNIKEIIDEVLEQLDSGDLRVCEKIKDQWVVHQWVKKACLLYTSPSPRDKRQSRMPSSA